MAKRKWKIEWRARAPSDGLERLGQAVKLAINRGALASETRMNENEERPMLRMDASVGVLEELNA
jgi:hypothetical protein